MSDLSRSKTLEMIERKPDEIFGIHNPGIYCYMISILQMLFTVKEFRDYITNIKYIRGRVKIAYGSNSEEILNKYCIYALYKLLTSRDIKDSGSSRKFLMSRPSGKNIEQVIKIFKERKNKDDFDVGRQNDAWEFLNLFLNTLHSECYKMENAIKLESQVDVSNKTSFITHLFKLNYDLFIHDISGTVRQINRDFADYDEIIKQENSLDNYVINIKLNDKDIYKEFRKRPTFQNLINLSLAFEPVVDDKGFELYIIEKKIHEFPTYIILCIDRFILETGDKNFERLIIPKTVNIFHHSYNIISIVCHDGRTVNSGHYRTYAERDGDWYCFNDDDYDRICFEEISHKISHDSKKYDRDGIDKDIPYILLCKITEDFESLVLRRR